MYIKIHNVIKGVPLDIKLLTMSLNRLFGFVMHEGGLLETSLCILANLFLLAPIQRYAKMNRHTYDDWYWSYKTIMALGVFPVFVVVLSLLAL
jgi:hypothetical protein